MNQLKYFVIITNLCFLFQSSATAQKITPSNTLPVNSTVNVIGNLSIINGGTVSGKNLFHSFSDFGVDAGNQAYFNNNSAISNIISRVIGGNSSFINGIISTNGGANLFLINPNGVIFGANAQLRLGGSFFASTANQISFVDGTILGTQNNNDTVLSSSNLEKLIFNANNSTIEVDGNGYNLARTQLPFPSVMTSNLNLGLQVQPYQTLGLIGGNVNVNNGIVSSPGGNLDIIGINEGSLTLNSGVIKYDKITSSGNVNLQNKSLIDVSGIPSGNINVFGNNISIVNGAVLLAQNYISNPAGSINLFANNLTIDGGLTSNISNPSIIYTGITSNSYGSGMSDSIVINTQNFSFINDVTVASNSYGSGKSGNIEITANKNSNFAGTPTTFSASPLLYTGGSTGIGTIAFGAGSGGDVLFKGDALNLSLNVTLNASTFGPGNSGNLYLDVNKLNLASGANLGTYTFAHGNGGNTIINSTQINVEGVSAQLLTPTVINSATFGSGNAGTLEVNAGVLSVENGGRVGTSTLNSGNAGDLTINAKSVNVSGMDSLTGTPSQIDSSALILSPLVQSIFGVPPIPTGKSGNLTINTNDLTVGKGGVIAATNEGLGDAGILAINANRTILLGGDILASTQDGNGGKITISTNTFASQAGTITASAQGNGNGGDVTFAGVFGVGDSQSYITADANNGFGGIVDINAQYFQFPRQNITAISQRGANYNGTVNVNGSTFSAIPKILASVESTKAISPLSCATYRGVAKVKNQAEFSPENTSDPIYFVDNKPKQQYYKDIRSGKILPMPEQTVWFKDNDDGTVSALSLADVQNINESFLKSQCFPATQAASKT